MKETKKQSPIAPLDKEPGKPGFEPGNTALPQQPPEQAGQKLDEDVKAEQTHEKLKQDTDDETKKIINEEEQQQVVNDDEPATETEGPPKMKAE
jgi:hypothetical protein